MDYQSRFRVAPGSTVDLRRIDAADTAGQSESDARDEILANAEKLRTLQNQLYAENRRSLLIALQAMDAGGKDGTIGHVFAALNPQGAYVHAFKQPTREEAAHDFLWRVHAVTPARGQVGIFNRSHYEDVLIARVHELVPEEVWSKRYDRINEFEKTLAQNDTHILKFYLHITPDEQLRRFKARLDDPHKQWKISEDDYLERAYWDDYIAAYEDALARCSTEHAPWYVIPANHKWFRNFAVSQIVVKTLEAMKTTYPPPRVDLADIRRRYHAAKEESTL
ncbi:MAG TPA: polyphosphate kinase 2 family protein [Candidatus Limnocylindria bacterium]|jgi:PPK2 family polyphosphate:nucleotide phosphotransferase|nr:polyphosphate kinase 2 family protein [Candidatus Limnocylindria bacterium]